MVRGDLKLSFKSIFFIFFYINMENFYIKEISDEEHHFNDYFDLMYEFSNYKKDVTYEYFKSYIHENRDKIRILVIYNNENKIIGAGSIFKLEKLHNNPIGQIEDVIINEKYRGFGVGKKIIKELVKIGIEDFKCYKVILNCLDKNIGFYENCNFNITGVQMKYNLHH
jgi:glucosamine-phosphate N-acetyltransferase